MSNKYTENKSEWNVFDREIWMKTKIYQPGKSILHVGYWRFFRKSYYTLHTVLSKTFEYPDKKKEAIFIASSMWAMADSNCRPLACQASALNQLS